MPVLVLGLIFVAASVAVMFYFLYAKAGAGERHGLDNCMERLEDIRSRLSQGLLTESEADEERLALLSEVKKPHWRLSEFHSDGLQTLPMSAAVFLLASGLVATFAYFGSGSATAQPEGINSLGGPDSEVGVQLADYIRTAGTQQPSPPEQIGELLPDVNVMIERLETRLRTTPDDVNGWQMLGWSYFNTGRFDEATKAFEKALQLNPGSADIRASYEEAKAKASGGSNLDAASATQSDGGSVVDSAAQQPSASVAVPALDSADPIRGMVDRLAKRLETSPRDPDGWIQLMRSRLVLGEEEVAREALQKALEVFTDDPATKNKIASAAAELGLKTQ
jgi:cytochrome c-type biogenesis protein CcmH